MDEGAGSRSPKTLADVSHLFFSRVEDSGEEPPEAPARLNDVAEDEPSPDTAAPHGDATWRESPADAGPRLTRLFVVTGGDDAPGKSTVAVNLATALAPFGRVAVFDADPRVPERALLRRTSFLALPVSADRW